jgi:hypothetical protein
VSLALEVGVLAGCVAATAALMLLVRLRSPTGGWFRESERAAAVFAFLGAGYAILLGFVILIAFDGYSNARAKAEDEATATFEQFQDAGLFTAGTGTRVRGELVCYARSVIFSEWPAMQDGRSSPLTESWIERIGAEVPRAPIRTMRAQEASTQWLEQSQIRDRGRRGRLLESQRPLPTLLWVLVVLGAAVLVLYTLLFADPGERAAVQAAMMGSVTGLVVAGLLAVTLLTSPFENANGSIKPSSMRYSLDLIEKTITSDHARVARLCDSHGNAVPS